MSNYKKKRLFKIIRWLPLSIGSACLLVPAILGLFDFRVPIIVGKIGVLMIIIHLGILLFEGPGKGAK